MTLEGPTEHRDRNYSTRRLLERELEVSAILRVPQPETDGGATKRMLGILQDLLLRAGIRVQRSGRAFPVVRRKLFAQEMIGCVLDVGANRGQYAREIRRWGYSGRIISCEPNPDACADLKRRALVDRHHSVFNTAIGSADGLGTLHVTRSDAASSLLPIVNDDLLGLPGLTPAGTREVTVCRLDTLAERAGWDLQRYPTHVKIDVQGSEMDVLLGARETLKATRSVELEISLVELYRGQALLPEVFVEMNERGYTCKWVEPGYQNPVSGWLLQLDALFVRNPS